MNQELLEELYRKYYQPLYLYAYSLTCNPQDAEDLTANTFVKAMTSFRKGPIQAWLYTVLRNEFYDLVRKRKRVSPLDDDVLNAFPSGQDVMEMYLHDERRKWLYREISKLPSHEREVMMLSIQTNYSDTQMSSILGLTPSHIRVLRHRAKQHLIAAGKEEKI